MRKHGRKVESLQDVDTVVIGAGVVGLACAAALARRGLSVGVVERNRKVGQETSARNSGVIHAGLYYPAGSLKARLCVEGRALLYARCERHGVPHRRCGKLLVATDAAELAKLESIHRQASANGAGDVRLVDGAEVMRREPAVRAIGGLWSPATGIVDVHALVDCYRREAEDHGAMLALDNVVTGLDRRPGGWRVAMQTGAGSPSEIHAAWVVNAAGLDASRIAALAGLDVDGLGLRLYPCKGDYFVLAPRYTGTFTHLVYPVPVHAGLGVHITFDLSGRVLAGPDTEYVDSLRYDVDPGKAAAFGAALRRYLPHVRDEDLAPGYAGIRPKLQGPGEPVRDFVIADASRDGAPRLINLIGIESPGLTSSEAIAGEVDRLIAA
jgi:L-2-hydroxyglutarate oxidase LhgO